MIVTNILGVLASCYREFCYFPDINTTNDCCRKKCDLEGTVNSSSDALTNI